MLVWGIKLLSQACEANSLPTNLPPMPCFSFKKSCKENRHHYCRFHTVFCGVRSQKVRHPSICGGWFLSAWLGRGASWVMRHYYERFCEGIFEWVLWILVWQALSVRWRLQQKKRLLMTWGLELQCWLLPWSPACRPSLQILGVHAYTSTRTTSLWSQSLPLSPIPVLILFLIILLSLFPPPRGHPFGMRLQGILSERAPPQHAT